MRVTRPIEKQFRRPSGKTYTAPSGGVLYAEWCLLVTFTALLVAVSI
jgi:hypothetical protein